MAYLTRDEILDVQGVKTEEVEVPEWKEGGLVLVRELPAAEVTRIGMVLAARGAADAMLEEGDDATVVAVEEISDQFPAIVAAAVVDPDSMKPLFNRRMVGEFSSRSAIPLQRIALTALRLSGLWGVEEEESEELPQQLAEHSDAVDELEDGDQDPNA